ncbi:2Fe-2S iron-sulfur cluster-binding protein [Paraburkholderia sp. ZP32-5]|uniref:2Fe-2S iron-sulfur cluster-binding protein n=1 Tax=Paraburkholderia sp. ZP32-5 TaxID=2883245 RepID=UPI0022789203|nr:2Fe-2S iron-sulfur cluster-binding protein [Paraburkholderia sp. ZP32-5]
MRIIAKGGAVFVFDCWTGRRATRMLGDARRPHGCTQGLCGTCRTRVLAGEPDHRDSVLSASERAEAMTVCV